MVERLLFKFNGGIQVGGSRAGAFELTHLECTHAGDALVTLTTVVYGRASEEAASR